MKAIGTSSISNRQRLWLLVALVLVLGTVLMRRKILPTWNKWRACEHLLADQQAGIDPVLEEQRLRQRLQELNSAWGDERPAEEKWSEVLTRVGAGNSPLVSIAPEHVELSAERTIRTLPIVVQGGVQDLLHLTDSLEHRTPGVHLASLDLHVDQRDRERRRPLQATLLLRTIAP